MAKSQEDKKTLKLIKRNIFSQIRYACCLQFALLQFFLLCVNFHILHPIQWLMITFKDIFCIGTVFAMFPLMFIVLLYDLVLCGRLLQKKCYHASRFTRILLPFVPKVVLLALQCLLGLTSAFLYVSYLPLDYRHYTFECYGSTCLNSRYLFLLFIGLASGAYHYVQKYSCQDPDIEFPIIQQRRLVQLRTCLTKTFYTTLWKTLLPTLGFSLLYGLFNRSYYNFLAHLFKLNLDQSMNSIWSVFTDAHLLFYAWLLQTHIISNFELLYRFYCIVFSDQIQYAISENKPIQMSEEEDAVVTLTKALRVTETPLVRNLAALQLYNISIDAGRRNERQELFSLTSLSDHPYNWHQLSVQCMCLITAFTDELTSAVKKISNIKITTLPPNHPNDYTLFQQTTPLEIAQKLLSRQQHENIGLRRMWTHEPQAMKTAILSKTSLQEKLLGKNEELPKLIKSNIQKMCSHVPFFNYLFVEPESGKAAYLLYNSQYMVWLTQGLAGLCALSVKEDHYGVVQSALPDVFSVLLKLKFELDKLNNVNLNGKKLDRHLICLKNAVKRSLYRMCSVFGDYLRDIVNDPQELQYLQCYVTYQEI